MTVGMTALAITAPPDSEYCALIDDAVRETEERRDRAERQARRHQKRRVDRLLLAYRKSFVTGKTRRTAHGFGSNRTRKANGAAASAGTETKDRARMK